MKVTVVKYETYPEENPNSYAVGFSIELANRRSFYVDTLVKFEDIESGMVDEEITSLAFEELKPVITEKVDELSYSSPSIIGMEFDMNSEYESAAASMRDQVEELIKAIDVILD